LTTLESSLLVDLRTTKRLAIAFAFLYAVLFIASLVIFPVLAPGARIPNPFGAEDVSRTFFLHNARAVRVSDFLQLASAYCFAGLAAALSGLQSIRRAPLASAMTQAGGIGGAVLLALTALCSWAIASPGAVDPGPALHTLQFLPFLFGGPGWAAFFGLFVAGVAMGTRGSVPRWVSTSGYILAVVSEVAMLVLVTIYASPCLPIARFLGFLWLILVSLLALKEADGTSMRNNPQAK
jgi:hypothetical protein